MAYTAVTNRLANERVRVEPLLLSQRRCLEMIVRGARLGDILTDICVAIELTRVIAAAAAATTNTATK